MIYRIDLNSWQELKNLVSSNNLVLCYKENDKGVEVFTVFNNILWFIYLLSNTSEYQDFVNNYKTNANKVYNIPVSLHFGNKTARISDYGRLLVDTSDVDYVSKIVCNGQDIAIPINTEYNILSETNIEGDIEEIHIITDSANFNFRLYIDETMVFNLKGNDLLLQYALIDGTISNIVTSNGKDFHFKNCAIYFSNSFKVAIINTTENNKKLKAFFISYRRKYES